MWFRNIIYLLLVVCKNVFPFHHPVCFCWRVLRSFWIHFCNSYSFHYLRVVSSVACVFVNGSIAMSDSGKSYLYWGGDGSTPALCFPRDERCKGTLACMPTPAFAPKWSKIDAAGMAGACLGPGRQLSGWQFVGLSPGQRIDQACICLVIM